VHNRLLECTKIKIDRFGRHLQKGGLASGNKGCRLETSKCLASVATLSIAELMVEYIGYTKPNDVYKCRG
jgi:hypothetical protein